MTNVNAIEFGEAASQYWLKLERDRVVHTSWAHYLEEYDFPSSKTSHQLMVASTPRSGSTAVCLELWRTGLLGAPLEYLNFHLTSKVGRWRFDGTTALYYWEVIHRLRTSANGVFSYKMFPSQYAELLKKTPQLVEKIAPNTVVHLSRRDKLDQAISLSKAARSGVWFAGAKPTHAPPPLDVEHVKKMYLALLQQENVWEQIFKLTNADVHRICYEDFCHDPLAVVSSVLAHAAVGTDKGAALSVPPIGVQRNETSKLWRDQLTALELDWRNEFESSNQA